MNGQSMLVSTLRRLGRLGIVPTCVLVLLNGAMAKGSPFSGPLGVSGTVRDATDAVVPSANVTLLTPMQAVVGVQTTDSDGRFSFDNLVAGNYVLLVKSRGFAERRLSLRLSTEPIRDVSLNLSIESPGEQVTVTANLGAADSVAAAPQGVNVIEREEISIRAGTVLAQAAAEEVGIHLQRTSPTIGGIYVRGFTGSKVNVYVDGVRYTTASMRGGINTFLDLVEPTGLEAIEVLRGPSSAQYGSDAIGGSVQLVSRVPAVSADGNGTVRASLETRFGSADVGVGSSLSGSYAGRKAGVFVNLAGRRANTLRPGAGVDSHAAVTRFLGLRSDAVGGHRLPDSAFTQYGGTTRVNWVPDARSQVVAYYGRGQQDGAKRPDQLQGGDGNLVADLRNLMLDFGYARFDRFGLGWLDHLSALYSFNSQREERVNQGGNGNPRATISHEYERTTVNGVQVFARKLLGAHALLSGAEYYHERVTAPSFGINPVTGTSSPRRGRVPDGTLYRSGAVYLEDTFQVTPDRLRLVGNLRYSAGAYRARAADSVLVGGKPLWPDDSLRVSDLTFRGAAIFTLARSVSILGSISRGFRAPGITDLGTFGLTGSGYEVSAPEVAGLGATIGSTADARAVSTGRAVEQLDPETSLNYEAGVRLRRSGLYAQVTFFATRLRDSIAKQSLILPQGAVGLVLAGQPIVAQAPGGAVFVAASTNPVLARANYGDANLVGLEHTLDLRVSSRVSIGTVFTWIRAEDPATGLPPNIEGGTPAPDGYLRLRYFAGGGRFWIEPVIHAAARQERLSSLDLEDRRTGASRSRTSIRNFFYGGATVRGFVNAGPDGISGNADDRLIATGETISSVQDRVLGPGVPSSPMFTAVPGYVTFDVRVGYKLGDRQEVLAQFVNLADRNYRGISWGMDAAGRSLSVFYRVRF